MEKSLKTKLLAEVCRRDTFWGIWKKFTVPGGQGGDIWKTFTSNLKIFWITRKTFCGSFVGLPGRPFPVPWLHLGYLEDISGYIEDILGTWKIFLGTWNTFMDIWKTFWLPRGHFGVPGIESHL